jgi:hypothetical protein
VTALGVGQKAVRHPVPAIEKAFVKKDLSCRFALQAKERTVAALRTQASNSAAGLIARQAGKNGIAGFIAKRQRLASARRQNGTR